MTPEVLDTSDEFVSILKWYANLNFALFSDTLALFRSLVKVIHSIKAFSWVDRNSMTLKTKASIIWIILLQSRKFSMGDTTILFEFSTMQTNLSSKKCIIIHAEVPIKLMGNPQRKHTRNFDPGTEPIPKNKREETHRVRPTLTPGIHSLSQRSRHPLKWQANLHSQQY